jgi:hypothetical protein
MKWAYLILAAASVTAVLLLVNDLRLEVRRTSRTVNEKLPEILEKSRRSADAMAEVSADIRQMRDLAGAPEGARDQTLVAYADALLDAVQASGGTIGLKPKLIGSELKDTQPAAEWAVAARKEALWLTLRVKSKQELLERLTKNMYGSEWYIQLPGKEPQALAEWLKANHPESREEK